MYVKLRIHSITLCDITIQIVMHRVDWFSCLAFVLLQHMPAQPPNLTFYVTCGWPQISLSKAAGCAPLVYRLAKAIIFKAPCPHIEWPVILYSKKNVCRLAKFYIFQVANPSIEQSTMLCSTVIVCRLAKVNIFEAICPCIKRLALAHPVLLYNPPCCIACQRWTWVWIYIWKIFTFMMD